MQKWQIPFFLVVTLISIILAHQVGKVGLEKEKAFWRQPVATVHEAYLDFIDEKIVDRYGEEMAYAVERGAEPVPLGVHNDFMWAHNPLVAYVLYYMGTMMTVFGLGLVGHEIIRKRTGAPSAIF